MPRYEVVAVEDAASLFGKPVTVWDNQGYGQGGLLLSATPEVIAVITPVGDTVTFPAWFSRIEIEVPVPADECLEYGPECNGAVDFHAIGNGRAFPRCEFHFDRRLDYQQGIDERYPVNPPSDWSPLDAGEYWDEDY